MYFILLLLTPPPSFWVRPLGTAGSVGHKTAMVATLWNPGDSQSALSGLSRIWHQGRHHSFVRQCLAHPIIALDCPWERSDAGCLIAVPVPPPQ